MPDGYDSLIASLSTGYNSADTARSSLNSNRIWAESHFTGGDDHQALEYAIKGMLDGVNIAAGLLAKGFYGWNGTTKALISALDRTKANPFITSDDVDELTMSSLLNVMLSADADDITYFIGIVDAYRQSIWNKPFNEEFYAALARGFEL